jgi:hypothetical protein
MPAHLNATSPPHLHCQFDFDWSSDFFSPLEIMASRMATIYGPQTAQANEKPPSESSLDLTQHLMMKNLKFERCALVLKLNLLEPSTIVFFRTLSHLGDLAVSRPRFWWQTWNHLWRLLRHRRYFYLCMVFSSWRWTLPLVARFDSLTAS